MENFYVNEFIGYIRVCNPKFYEEFVLNFENIESFKVSINLVIKPEDYEYHYPGCEDDYKYDYYNMAKDLGLHYGIYKNEEELYKDIEQGEKNFEKFDKFIEYFKKILPDFFEKLYEQELTSEEMFDITYEIAMKCNFEKGALNVLARIWIASGYFD